ncbi:MAG: site-specific DNA-methyltransferase [Spirochaetaceae bacterium]|nr:site-specific DNA-methyltransferase [Spirochaetaceae bacterium]
MTHAPSPRNRSLRLDDADRDRLAPLLAGAAILGGGTDPIAWPEAEDRVIQGDCLAVLPRLPRASFDLLVADPPYNLAKDFGAERGRRMDDEAYEAYTGAWLDAALPLLKPDASVYVFGDWRGSSALYRALSRRLVVRNKIVWEREKGRAAAANWKSAHEEIWFATTSETWRFDTAAVRQRRLVRAPYRDEAGRPKDWVEDEAGRYRDTAASNIWTDLTVPYWSMPENTPHPTQKPEKLLAKLLLASVAPGGRILDPFLGSGTSAVVAKKLGRRFVGVELDAEHCLHALRRLELAGTEPRIQGYEDGVFWERNSSPRRGPTR